MRARSGRLFQQQLLRSCGSLLLDLFHVAHAAGVAEGLGAVGAGAPHRGHLGQEQMIQWAAATMSFSLKKGSTAQSRSLQSLERLVMASARDEDITRANSEDKALRP